MTVITIEATHQQAVEILAFVETIELIYPANQTWTGLADRIRHSLDETAANRPGGDPVISTFVDNQPGQPGPDR